MRPPSPGVLRAAFGFGVSNFGFGFRVSGFGFRVSGFGFRGSGFEFQVSGFEVWVSGLWFWFEGGLVFKIRRILYHSTLGLRVKKKRRTSMLKV